MSATSLYRRIQNIVENPRDFIQTKTYFGPDRRRFTNGSYSGEDRRSGDNTEHIVDPDQIAVDA